MSPHKFFLITIALLLLAFAVAPLRAEVTVSRDGCYVLTDFGPVKDGKQAQETLGQACTWIVGHGGGLLIIPPGVAPALDLHDLSPRERLTVDAPVVTTRDSRTGFENLADAPTVTILDRRDGYERLFLPQVGKLGAGGWAGMEINRTLNMPQSLPHWTWTDALVVRNNIIRGSSSVLRSVLDPISKGKDARIYPSNMRGIYPGQFLNIGPYAKNPEYIRIKTVGWDEATKRPFCTADVLGDHPAGEMLSNKNFMGTMQLVTSHNSDTQTFDFDVRRYQYSQGDTFVISGTYVYQGDVHSGLGDENGNVYNAEIEQDPDPFNGEVDSVDWSGDILRFRNGARNVHKLATSRPIINMNRQKWITTGVVRIVPPEEWSGLLVVNPKYKNMVGDFVKNGIDMQHFDLTYMQNTSSQPSITTWDDKPVRALKYVYQGRAYPSIIYKSANQMGGRIIGSADCGWSTDIVGRYFAVAQQGEYVTPADAGYLASPRRDTYRWYLIKEFAKNPDGTCTLRIERTRWATVNAGSPTLYVQDNYTWDGHDRPLKYFIAPGALAYDISGGWQDAANRGGAGYGVGTIKVLANRERNTALDFASGDPIEEAIGADPYLPVAFRIRLFNKVPTSFPMGAIELMQNGQISNYAGLQFDGPFTKSEGIAGRKDRKPPYENGIVFNSVMGAGLRFAADMSEAALLFEQPNHPQILKWLSGAGATELAVDPKSGTMSVTGGAVSMRAITSVHGLSATSLVANNLRGIDIAVKKGLTQLVITFPIPEPDARYALHIQPNWFTQARVAKKTATGFTVDFSSPAPAGGTVDWILVR